MNDGFRPIYSRLYKAYLEGRDEASVWPEGTLRENVNYAIEAVQLERQQSKKPTFREDAKHLLLICFTEMVYKPLASFDSPIQMPPNLSSTIQNDIRTIADKASAPGILQISAQAVLNSLGTTWDNILSGAKQLWEGDEQ